MRRHSRLRDRLGPAGIAALGLALACPFAASVAEENGYRIVRGSELDSPGTPPVSSQMVAGVLVAEGEVYYLIRRGEPDSEDRRSVSNWLARVRSRAPSFRWSDAFPPPFPVERTPDRQPPSAALRSAVRAAAAWGGDSRRQTGMLWRAWSEELHRNRGIHEALLLASVLGGIAFFYLRRVGRRASSAPGPAPDPGAESMRGAVGSVSIESLLQMLHADRRTGKLDLRGPDGNEGWIWIEGGELHSARLGELRDVEAVHALLARRAGEFVFTARKTTEEARAIRDDLIAVLMEAHRRMDEASKSAPLS